jgi:hypothetical protein
VRRSRHQGDHRGATRGCDAGTRADQEPNGRTDENQPPAARSALRSEYSFGHARHFAARRERPWPDPSDRARVSKAARGAQLKALRGQINAGLDELGRGDFVEIADSGLDNYLEKLTTA